jgi:2-polyprenyl-3-methyl-5-hydroxy-6-metoxy-1,4-benzoquinol methylase
MNKKSLMKEMWNQRAEKDAFYYVESTFWDRNIESFFALGEQRAELIIDSHVGEFISNTSSASALEIGCGVGRFSRALAKRFDNVIAVDVSEAMIQKAQELHPVEEYPNLKFQSTDGKSLSSVLPASIDFVFSYEVFQHMPSYEVILNNFKDIQTVLKPTGIAFIHLRTESFFSSNTIKSFLKKIIPNSVWTTIGFKPFTFDDTWTGTSLSRKTIKQLCKLSNLKILQFIDDPTHSLGTRIFLIATPISSSITS